MGDRTTGRELAFRALFQLPFEGADRERVLKVINRDEKGRDSAKVFARDLVEGCLERLEAVDSLIRASSANWDLERLGNHDRAILRIGAFELVYREDIPDEVSIDEAVELAKKYGDDDSARFVNGILDEIRKKKESTKSGG